MEDELKKEYELNDVKRRLDDILIEYHKPVDSGNLSKSLVDSFENAGLLEKAEELVYYIEQRDPRGDSYYASIRFFRQLPKLFSEGVEANYISQFIDTFKYLHNELLPSYVIKASEQLCNALIQKGNGELLKKYVNLIKSTKESWYSSQIAEDFPRVWLEGIDKSINYYIGFVQDLLVKKAKRDLSKPSILAFDMDENDALIRIVPNLVVNGVGEEVLDFYVAEIRKLGEIDAYIGYTVAGPMAALLLGGVDIEALKKYSNYIENLIEYPEAQGKKESYFYKGYFYLESPIKIASDTLTKLFLNGTGYKYIDVYMNAVKETCSQCKTSECVNVAKKLPDLFEELTPSQVNTWVDFGIELSKSGKHWFFHGSTTSYHIKKMLKEDVPLKDVAKDLSIYNEQKDFKQEEET